WPFAGRPTGRPPSTNSVDGWRTVPESAKAGRGVLGVVVLVVLAAIWAAFLLPPILRDRQNNRPAGSIYDFRRQLHVLARSTPAGVGASGMRGVASVPYRPAVPVVGARRLSRQRTIRRRRDIVLGLLVAMGGSLVLGLLPPLRV